MKTESNKNNKIELRKEDIDYIYSILGFKTDTEFDKGREPLPNKLYTLNDQEPTITLSSTKVNNLDYENLIK